MNNNTKKYTNIAVKVNNFAEKLATLYHLGNIFKLQPADTIINKILRDGFCPDDGYDFVFSNYLNESIDAANEDSWHIKNSLIFEFKDLGKTTVNSLDEANKKWEEDNKPKLKVGNILISNNYNEYIIVSIHFNDDSYSFGLLYNNIVSKDRYCTLDGLYNYYVKNSGWTIKEN